MVAWLLDPGSVFDFLINGACLRCKPKIAQECALDKYYMVNIEILEQFKKVLSWLFQKEVKTPLSFNFRIAWFIVVMFIVMVIWGQPALQLLVFLTSFGLLALLIIVVAIFSWYRPKNLIYGEPGHRAEMKLGYGTEKKELTSAEVSSLPGIEKPAELPASGETS